MAEVGGFPVVFYDGKHKTTFGNVDLNPMIDYEEFRTMLSDMIGISHNNVITFLIGLSKNYRMCNKRERRAIVITSKVDFSDLVQDVECAYFLVVLNRSKRERRKKSTREKDDVGDKLLLPKNLFDLCFDQYRGIAPQVDESDKVESSVVEAYNSLCVECEKGNRVCFKDHPCKYDKVFEGLLGPSSRGLLCVDDMPYPKVDKSVYKYDEVFEGSLDSSSWGPLCVHDTAYPHYQYNEVFEGSLGLCAPLCVDDMTYPKVENSMYECDEVFEGFLDWLMSDLLCVDDTAYPKVEKSMYQSNEVFNSFLGVSPLPSPNGGPMPKEVSDYIL